MKTELFISCCGEDGRHGVASGKREVALQSPENIAPWHIRQILLHETWDLLLLRDLDKTAVLALFVGASIFATEYVWEVQLARVKERFEAGKCAIAIIIVEPCVWRVTWLKQVSAPNGGQVIATAAHPGAPWTRVGEDLMVLMEKVNARKRGGK